jgi:hypothetical protein
MNRFESFLAQQFEDYMTYRCQLGYDTDIPIVRRFLTSRKEYWNQLRCTIRILIFPSFESLLKFIINPEGGIPP